MKYLFSVQFNDGAIFNQNKEDQHPTKKDKSSFTHLMEEAKIHQGIKTFSLHGEENFLVDLTDGHFEINGVRFDAHGQDFIPQDLRLVYFRQHRHTLNGGVETAHEITFFLGWQCTIDGKNYQQTISIK